MTLPAPHTGASQNAAESLREAGHGPPATFQGTSGGIWVSGPSIEGPQLGRTGPWTSKRHRCLPVRNLGMSFRTSQGLGSLVCHMGTVMPPHARRMKGGRVRTALDTSPGAQNVHNQLFARMFQTALLGKVRCPIRRWRLPWKHGFLCTKGQRMPWGQDSPLRLPLGCSVPPGRVLIGKTLSSSCLITARP